MTELRLHTFLESSGPAAAIVLTDEQVAAFGAGKVFPVVVSFGDRSIRLRLARMGGRNLIGFSQAARAEMGLEKDQEIDVTITVDTAEREVEIPPALADALGADAGLRDAFDALSYSKRKEHARQVAEAKTDETRARRVEKVLAALRA